MLLEEAKLIRNWIAELDIAPGSVCLNLGSSTKDFRERVQPFIATEIIEPLERSGCRVVHCDLKSDEGVDEVGDILDPDFQVRLRSYIPDLVICSNILEHVVDPKIVAAACGVLAKEGGHCLLTVPMSFPYHPDPIDTMYRPDCAKLSALLPGWEVIHAGEVSAGNLRSEWMEDPNRFRTVPRQVLRALMPFYRPRAWYPAAHKLLWLFRKYRVSAALLRKPHEARP